MIDLDGNKTPEAIIAEAMVSAGAPLMHSRVEEAVAGALRKAGILAEQSGQVCAWCPSPARGSAHHNDGKLHPSCGQTNHGQGWVPDYPVERIGAIEAERDAAVAAIKRAQETLSLHNPNGRLVKEVLAALDGAPEPEWEYGMQDDYGLSFVGNIAEAYDHANRQDPELNPRPVRRRKAGPWEPVWGESKP